MRSDGFKTKSQRLQSVSILFLVFGFIRISKVYIFGPMIEKTGLTNNSGRDVRMEGGQMSGNTRATTVNQFDTEEDPKSTEVKINKRSQDAKSSADSANPRTSYEDWEQMKGICSKLYLVENKSVGEVKDLMRSIYGFSAG